MLQRQERKGLLLEPERLKAIYAAQMTKVEHHLQAHPHSFTLLNVTYNDLLSDAELQVEKIDTLLGGGLNRSAMVAAVDPSLYRNRVG